MFRRCSSDLLFIFVILALVASLFVAVIALGPCIIVENPSLRLGHPLDRGILAGTNKTSYKVILFGDSLVNTPYQDYHMKRLILQYFPKYPIGDIVNAGVGGDRIYRMRDRLYRDALDLNPDAMILLWDSDCSDIDESDYTPDGITELRKKYEDDLVYVVEEIQKAGVYLVISGPILLGEIGKALKRDRQRILEKEQMLDDYRAINRKVAENHNVSYIDLRDNFQRAIPFYRLSHSGCVTSDGEHENENGTKIVARLFAGELYKWFRSLVAN